MQRQKMKILLLEDDTIIADAIQSYFELNDFSVDLYSNGEELVESADPKNYDIMLLDINTPGINGLEVLQTFRELSIDTPAIFITALSDIEYLKKAYSIGCSDYIKKPFDIEELELRINNIINKNRSKIDIGDGYSFDMKKEKLYHNKEELNLNQKERRFLYLLLKHKGSIVSSDAIKCYLWDDKDVCDNTLRTTVKKLRNKLESNFISNSRGLGYKIDI